MMLSYILETVMLLCFAAAWPASIYKSWTSRTRKGKSLSFMLIIIVGYIAGIAKVLVSNSSVYMLIPYTLNTVLVGGSAALITVGAALFLVYGVRLASLDVRFRVDADGVEVVELVDTGTTHASKV